MFVLYFCQWESSVVLKGMKLDDAAWKVNKDKRSPINCYLYELESGKDRVEDSSVGSQRVGILETKI